MNPIILGVDRTILKEAYKETKKENFATKKSKSLNIPPPTPYDKPVMVGLAREGRRGGEGAWLVVNFRLSWKSIYFVIVLRVSDSLYFTCSAMECPNNDFALGIF